MFLSAVGLIINSTFIHMSTKHWNMMWQTKELICSSPCLSGSPCIGTYFWHNAANKRLPGCVHCNCSATLFFRHVLLWKEEEEGWELHGNKCHVSIDGLVSLSKIACIKGLLAYIDHSLMPLVVDYALPTSEPPKLHSWPWHWATQLRVCQTAMKAHY